MVTTKTYKAKPAPKGFVCPDGGKISKTEYLARMKAWQEEQVEVEEVRKEIRKRKATKKETKSKK